MLLINKWEQIINYFLYSNTMSIENEPKTIEDYKDVVKLLKLKIIKQAKKLQEMELKVKNYEEQINNVSIGGPDWQVSSRAMAQL